MSDGTHCTMLCRLLGAAAVLALLAAPAAAQLKMPGIDISPGSNGRVLTPEEQEKQKAIDDKYKATMQAIPDQKKPADPWGNIRSAPTTKQR